MADRQEKQDAEEIRDILIAISVVAKRLATKLENGQLQEDCNEQKQE
jgi:hypothetical protein